MRADNAEAGKLAAEKEIEFEKRKAEQAKAEKIAFEEKAKLAKMRAEDPNAWMIHALEMSRVKIEDMTCSDIVEWCSSLKLPSIAKLIENEKINGDMLNSFSPENLTDIGLPDKGTKRNEFDTELEILQREGYIKNGIARDHGLMIANFQVCEICDFEFDGDANEYVHLDCCNMNLCLGCYRDISKLGKCMNCLSALVNQAR